LVKYKCYFYSVVAPRTNYHEGPIEFDTDEEALAYARQLAIDDYEDWEGYYGVLDVKSFIQFGFDEEKAYKKYLEYRENRLDYGIERIEENA
jgi:hypothetical protein